MVLCLVFAIISNQVWARAKDDVNVFVFSVVILFCVTCQCTSINISFSVFLMQSLDETHYHQFLRIFYMLKIHYISTCCTFDESYNKSQVDSPSTPDADAPNRNTMNTIITKIDRSVTQDHSEYNHHSEPSAELHSVRWNRRS